MASGSEEARFSIKVSADTGSADSMANSMDGVRESIEKNEDAIKTMVASLRLLRGKDKETTEARDKLKASIEAHRKENTKATLEILKQGTSLDALAKKSRKAAEAEKDAKAAIAGAAKSAGGPIGELFGKFESLNGLLSGAGGATAIAVAGIAALAAAVVALGVAVVATGVSFAKFVLESTNLARTQNLTRLAFTNNAENAKNLGTQVDALARKIPTAKDKLNELAASLAVTRLSGQTQVDTFNLVGQAAAAMGDQVGSKLQEIVTRSQLTRRMFLNPMELLGTGLQFNDVAEQLAKATNVSVAKAKQALAQGAVPLGVGAEALRKAVEKRFGQVNLMKMLDFDVLKTKFGESIQYLTRNIKTEKLVEGFGKLAAMVGPGSMVGAGLEKLVTLLGSGLVKGLEMALPVAEAVFEGMTIGALLLALAVVKTKNRIEDAFGKSLDTSGLVTAEDATKALTLAIDFVKVGIETAALAIASLAKAAAIALKPVALVAESAAKIAGAAGRGWKAIGGAMIDGLVDGVKDKKPDADKAIHELAAGVQKDFKADLVIESPSKVFRGFGRNISEGAALGVSDDAPKARAAVSGLSDEMTGAMGDAPTAALERASSKAPSGGARGATGPITVNLTINVEAGAKDAAKALSEGPFLKSLTKALEDALVSAGGVPA